MALRSRRPLLAAGLLVAAILIASCGGGGATDTASSDGPSSTSSSLASSTSSSSGSSTETTAGSTTTTRPEREYPAGGPLDPIVPPGDASYELIAAGGCEQLLAFSKGWGQQVAEAEGKDTKPLYESAALACLGRWSEAKQVFDQIDVADPTFLHQQCPRRAVLAWVASLIHEWQDDHRFSPTFVESSTRSSCPGTSDTSDTSGTSDTSDPSGSTGTGDPSSSDSTAAAG